MLDIEIPIESLPAKSSFLELKVRVKSREIGSVGKELVRWGETVRLSEMVMLEATWLLMSESFSSDVSTSRSKPRDFMI